MPLSKDEIFARSAKVKLVEVPDLGEVGLRVVGTGDLIDWTGKGTDDEIGFHLMARLLVKTLCDGSGKRLFTDDDVDSMLTELAPDTIRFLYDKSTDWNRLTKANTDDDAKKN